jgi:hypothetical protein
MLSEGCSELRNWCDVEGWILRFGLVCREQHASELVIKYRQHLGWPGARASERQCVIEAPDRTATTHGSRLNNVGGSETHRWRAFENRRKLRCVLALVVRAQAFDADRFGGRVQPRLDLDHTASLRAACGPRCGIVGCRTTGREIGRSVRLRRDVQPFFTGSRIHESNATTTPPGGRGFRSEAAGAARSARGQG